MHLTPQHVARAFRAVAETDEADLYGWERLSDSAIAEAAETILAERPPGPLHVFAYGSLLWKPEFAPVSTTRGEVEGWHRSFCIRLNSWRGTPEAPGLMMALMPGGRCTGLLLEVPEAEVAPAVAALVKREIPFRELLGARTWMTAQTVRGPQTALAFYAPPPVDDDLLADLKPLETARMIARACGHVGSNAEYLHETMRSLAAHGIRDGRLWHLQKLVAAELDS